MNEVMKSLLSHQSIRAYTEQMVEEEKNRPDHPDSAGSAELE